ncbi:MAG: hypothetical protein LBT92_03100, partial [Rickettsiales bacterium]|nr:hypothetical protein [Rickettsiales bacterium]
MPKSMLRIAAFLFIASCAAVMDYGPRELTIRREMKFPGRTKSELYAQSMEFALGEMGLATFRVAYHSKGDGKLIVRGSVNENVSGFYNDSIAVTFDVSVEKGKASAAISNPIMES